jgi:hypothetical protein
MDKFIYIAAALSCFLLLSLAGILAKLNWNDEVRGRAFSIVLGGAAALLIAVLSTLKASQFQKSYVTAVPFNDVAGGPPLTGSTSGPRWDELAMLARPAVQKNGKTVVTISTPSPDERFSFCGELVQYEITKKIRELSRGGRWKISITPSGAQGSLSPEMKLSNGVDVPGKTYLSQISKNRFSNSDIEQFYWNSALFVLPPEADLELEHLPTSPSTGTEKFLVRLVKKMYFRYEILIEPLASTGPGAVPPPLQGVLSPEVQQKTNTYFYQITTKATFERLTSGSKESGEYRQWLEWLSSMLQQQMA